MDRPDDQHPQDDEQALAELDRLNAACAAAPDDIDAQIRLWMAVAGLERWVFIDRGTEGSPRPYALAAGPGHMLCIYSSADRAQAGARANGLVPEGTLAPVFALPQPAAIDWALSLGESGVVGVTIDYPQLGAWCPLPNLARLRDQRA